MKNIVILGSTGSVGRQTLEVVEAHPEEFKIVGLGCNSDIDLLIQQAEKFNPEWLGVVDEEKGHELKLKIKNSKLNIFYGLDSLSQIAQHPNAQMVVVAVMGAAGIAPTLAAIKAKKDIALATKEVMVAAGDLINDEVKKYKVNLIPVDSEHNAIFQCLHRGKHEEVGKIYLTCSGGAFRGMKKSQLANVKPEDALKHPNWKMGAKITIDCATLMNKGLEMIEAQKLFNLNIDQVKVILHPQSIIHSMVEYVDGNIIAQLGPADMRFPIRYALAYPKRLKNHFHFLDPFSVGQISFSQPDWDTFECLTLAYKAAEIGGTMPVVLNAADEVAVNLFLKNKIKFLEIPKIVKAVMNQHKATKKPVLEEIFRVDQWAREKASGMI
jgi:1-deoxy-D-xylulose-5-phosphate reductoisomerase